MIRFTKESIFDVSATARIAPVNTVGTMGAGLAKEFKRRYPHFDLAYRHACKQGEVKVGQNYYYDHPSGVTLVALATKKDWRDPSELDYVRQGLEALRWDRNMYRSESIAVPALGCGLGGLDWNDVRGIIVESFEAWRYPVDVIVCEPR